MELICFIGELIGGFFFGLYSTFVGVLWPAKTPKWAMWQETAVGCLLIALILFGISLAIIFTSGFAWSVLYLWGAALIPAIIFSVIGNECRKFHEEEHKRNVQRNQEDKRQCEN